jgi:hypothetical protein
MLLPDNIHPEQSIYFNASFLLKELLLNRRQDMIDLYQKVKEKKNMSFPIFILCLDWLFLLSVLQTNKDGTIELCI